MVPQTNAPSGPPQADEFEPYEVHFLGPLTFPVDRTHAVMRLGSVVTVTREVFEATKDRNGDSVLDILDDEQEQIHRYGRVMIRRGPWPEGKERLERGSQEWWDAAEAERRAAHGIENEAERRRALGAIRAKFGIQPTSQTLGSYDNGKRDAEAWR